MFDVKTMNLGEELNSVKGLPGEERVHNLKYEIEYAKKYYGEEGEKNVMAELKKHGIDLSEVIKQDDLAWMPSDYSAQYMLAMAKVFNWRNEDVVLMGKRLLAFSRIMKFFVKYFVSLPMTLKRAVSGWNAHYNWGKMEIIDLDMEKKFALYRTSKFKKHPITCLYIIGVISGVAELAIGQNTKVTEEKCMFRNDEAHEFRLIWK